ncbi:plasmid pRiA4b ORF-3 family protein [Kribbella catacumbae]|uniref:plasmid pRiA4b ORF-3 family protein n=1 Tax=Kribbella catacumbae TaxID=460086 RepID=UPI00192B704A|nr:plasmid pRiA4b ORF-3 family protein [Kribbella catacumbae]
MSRARKTKKNKKSTQRPARPDLLGGPDECDCPVCSGADFDPRELIDGVVAGAAELAEADDPLDAEMLGAAFVSIGALDWEAFEQALIEGFVPRFEDEASTGALAMLLAIRSVAPGQAGKAASAAADRLVEAGVEPPGWAAELAEPVKVADCWRLQDAQGAEAMLACVFHRAGRSHAVMVSVDNLDCGAAGDILLLDSDQLPAALEMTRADALDSGVELTTEVLDAAEFRWQVERALDARAVHGSELDDLDGVPDDEDGPGYPVLAMLMRARMTALPTPSKSPASHGDGETGLTTLQMLAQFVGNGSPFGAGGPVARRGRPMVAELPAKPKRSGRPAPVYQIKVGLRGAKPPIWRRLEVPGDISLARLHRVIQVAFGWYDSHLHVFETPYGEFGMADAELGHRAEAPVTLEQVAPTLNSKLRYTYDFGDDWEHDILVEKVHNRETAAYPRCTGGRRAAPPEDCGGVWGYADLVEILSDPDHLEHQERLEWLGLDSAADFNPASFDAEATTKALSSLR